MHLLHLQTPSNTLLDQNPFSKTWGWKRLGLFSAPLCFCSWQHLTMDGNVMCEYSNTNRFYIWQTIISVCSTWWTPNSWRVCLRYPSSRTWALWSSQRIFVVTFGNWPSLSLVISRSALESCLKNRIVPKWRNKVLYSFLFFLSQMY